MSFAFDETYYLKSKLQQLIKTDAATYGSWSTSDVKDAIEAAGMTVQDHCNQYSLVEGTSANPYFNTTEYLEAKLVQLKSVDPTQYSTWTVADVVKAFQDAGFTSAEDHYNQYGCKETDATGHLINPSNAFDANAYVQAKLAQLVAADPETYGEWTAADVAEAIADAGMSPVEHFEEYGKAEGQAAGIDMVQTVPVTQRVTNDELRDGMGENVPSNYNKPVDAPKDVDASEAGSVDKPCDMATATNKPADPVAVPGDSGYVDVPGGGIEDKAGAEVTLVTAEVKDNTGKVIDTETQYGVATTETKDGVTTTTVKGVDATGAVTEDTIQTVTTDPAKGTTTTETKLTDSDGNTLEVKEEVTTVSDGTTTTKTEATATDATGKQTAKTESTETQASDGTTTSDVKYTDADGKTTETTTDAEGNTETKDVTDDDNGGGSSGGAGTGTGSPDGVGPVIKSVEFAKDDDGNDIPTQFVLTFDENVKDAGIKYSANGGADTAVTSAVVDGKTVTVTVSTLKAGDSVVFKVGAGVTDSLGNNSKDQTSDALTVPARGTLTATGGTTLTVEGKTENAVVIDDAGFTVKDGTDPVAPNGDFNASTTTIDVKGVQAASITIDGVPATTTEIDTSDLTVTTVNLSAGTQALTIGGTATKAANTVVTGLAENGSVTGTGAFTVGNGGLEVTHATVTATNATTMTLATQSDTVVKGAVAGALNGATAFVVSGTNKIDLTGITDLGASVKTLNISNIATEAKVTSDQLAGLTTVTGHDGNDILVVAGKATVDAAKLGDYTVKSEENGGTIEVSADKTITGANIDDSFTGLTVASGATATLDNDALTQFTAAKTSIGGTGTITTAVTAVSLGAGTVDLTNGTLALADGTTLTAEGALSIGTVSATAADSLTLAVGTNNVTVGTLTGKSGGTAVEFTGTGTVTIGASTNANITAADNSATENTLVLTGANGGLTVDLGLGKDVLTMDGHTGTVSVNLGVKENDAGDNADTITGFVAGTTGDKLVFAKDSVAALDNGLGNLVELSGENAADLVIDAAKVNLAQVTGGTLTASMFKTASTDATGEIIMAKNTKAYILATEGTEEGATATTYNVYNVDASNADAPVYTVDLVGTVTITGDLNIANFDVAS